MKVKRPVTTTCWKVDSTRPDPEIISGAGLILCRGGLVAFPTETVYGLGANAMNADAVRKIFAAKGRPVDNPLIVHLATSQQVETVARLIMPYARDLMKAFWPGPLTLVLPGKGVLPREVTAGLDTLAVRVPDHQVARDLIQAAGVPVAAPSANTSGRPSPTTAEHVLADLDGLIDGLLDAGPAGLGVESTVLDATGEIPLILRPGGVTPEQIKSVAGAVKLDSGVNGDNENNTSRPRSPGMKYRHYSPITPLVLVEGEEQQVSAALKKLAWEYGEKGYCVGVLCTKEVASDFNNIPGNSKIIVELGDALDIHNVAFNLYGALRDLDASQADIILAQGIDNRELGLAVMNRLRRAAEKIVVV